MKVAETDIGKHVVAHFEGQGYDVYQEVMGPHSYGVADIVAKFGKTLVVVELKKSLTFEVIAQAIGWRSYATLIYVGVPPTLGRSAGRALAYRVCAENRVGVLEVGPRHDDLLREQVQPGFNRRAKVDAFKLCPEQKTAALAGSSGGGHYTPFKGTCSRLLQLVKAEPGIALAEAVVKIQHHYRGMASARASLKGMIERKLVPGVRIMADGKKLRLYYVPAQVADLCE